MSVVSCFLGFPGKFSVEARSYTPHRASVFLGLGTFKNTLCQLEHLSSEMKIVGIGADQSGTNHTVRADPGQREGSWSLVTLHLDSCHLCLLLGQPKRPGKHFSHY